MTIVEWCRAFDIWYLKIDIKIPEICIKEAQAVYDEGFFVEHRGGDGNGGCLPHCMVLFQKIKIFLWVGIILWAQTVMDLQKRV